MYKRNATKGKKDELSTNGLRCQGRTTSSLRAMGLGLLLFTCHAVALAQSNPTEFKWGELPQIIEPEYAATRVAAGREGAIEVALDVREGFKINRISPGQGNPNQAVDDILFFTNSDNWPQKLYEQY